MPAVVLLRGIGHHQRMLAIQVDIVGMQTAKTASYRVMCPFPLSVHGVITIHQRYRQTNHCVVQHVRPVDQHGCIVHSLAVFTDRIH